MGKRIIDNFDRYHSMLISGNEDFIKFALQDLFELFGKGYITVGSTYRRLSKDLNMLLSKSPSGRIRKWVYHCACYCPEKKVIDKCLQKIFSEKKRDNILWCLSALSTTYTEEELKSKLPKQKIDEFCTNVSPDIFEIASNLFSVFKPPTLSQDKVQSIIQHGKPTDKIFVTTVFGYPEIAARRRVSDIVTERTVESLTNDDDPSVREYAYWALCLGNGLHQKRLCGDRYESKDIKKWIYANDITVLNKQQRFDLIEEILYNASVQEIPIKVGILRGLESVDYRGEYVNILVAWLNREEDPYIRTKILERFVKYCVKNAVDENEKKGSYITVLEDELNHGTNSYNIELLRSYIGEVSDIHLNKKRHYWAIDGVILNKNGGNKKMEVFLGSSTESVSDMERIAADIARMGYKPLQWDAVGEGIFPPNSNTIDSLINIADRVSAAIFIFSADDTTWKCGALKGSEKVRDNVLFEYGLFLGKLGKNKVCFVCKGAPDLASDLHGVTFIDGDKDNSIIKMKLKDWFQSM